MDVALHNDAHSGVVRDEKTAFELRWKRPPRGTLYSFGCEIWALRDAEDRDKYESRGERGIFVAYEGEESVSYLRFSEAAGGKFRLRSTRDFQALRNKFPMREFGGGWAIRRRTSSSTSLRRTGSSRWTEPPRRRSRSWTSRRTATGGTSRGARSATSSPGRAPLRPSPASGA